MVNLRIGDVDIQVMDALRLNLGTFYFEAESSTTAKADIRIWWEKVRGPASKQILVPEIDLEERLMKITGVVSEAGEDQQSEYFFRRYLGFFAGLLSDNFNFVHGAGLEINEKGVLILGTSGAGKSTMVADFIGNSKMIDDDMIMTDWHQISRICKYSQRYRSRYDKRCEMIYDQFYSCPLNYIVILNPRLKAEEIRESDQSRIAQVAFDDRIDSSFKKMYETSLTLPEKVPIYEIGTSGPGTITKHTILQLVQ